VNTRIADSERNRPAPLAIETDGAASMMQDALRAFLANGLAPAVVADRVFDAVHADRFWVLTDDDGDAWTSAIRARARSIEEGTNPGFVAG
jgi:hypothetical protein